MHSKEKGLLYIWNFLFHKSNNNHTKNIKTEAHSFKKEETEGKVGNTTKQKKQQTKTQRRRTNVGAELPENKK